jgi:hypothetical protein
MITYQLTHNDIKDLRVQILLDSGQVPGISVPHQTLNQFGGLTQTPSSATGTPLVQAIAQTFVQLGLTLPGSPDSSNGSTLSAAGIDSVFEQFIGQILHVASSLQDGAMSSEVSQSNSGNQGNGASVVAYSNPLAQALESLAQAAGAGGSSQPGDATGSSTTGSTTSLNRAISGLTQDFNTLFGSSGSGNGASLQAFLQTFASNVAEESASGSGGTFVQTSA